MLSVTTPKESPSFITSKHTIIYNNSVFSIFLIDVSPVQTFKWKDEDLRKLAGENILRVFREVEKQKKGQTF